MGTRHKAGRNQARARAPVDAEVEMTVTLHSATHLMTAEQGKALPAPNEAERAFVGPPLVAVIEGRVLLCGRWRRPQAARKKTTKKEEI